MAEDRNYEAATFAGGCFWGIEDAFRKVKGVKDAVSGYAGGHTEHPTYEQVCAGTTGHAESVEVTFDPNEVSYEELLKVFWDIHNPTTLDRQGPDAGHQYRSVIFAHSPAQKAAAEKSKAEFQKSGKYERDIVTEIVPAGKFWRAEEYHQRYFEKHGGGVCHV